MHTDSFGLVRVLRVFRGLMILAGLPLRPLRWKKADYSPRIGVRGDKVFSGQFSVKHLKIAASSRLRGNDNAALLAMT
jgi:hypothetical protein